VAIDHNKTCATSGCKRFLAGPMGISNIHNWLRGPAKDSKHSNNIKRILKMN